MEAEIVSNLQTLVVLNAISLGMSIIFMVLTIAGILARGR